MAFDVRPLLAKIGMYRPDLDMATAKLRYCLDEAVRETCRRTFLAREVVAATLTAGNRTLTPTLTAGRNLLRVHRLDFLDADSGEYILVQDASYYAMRGNSMEISSTGTSPSYWSQQGSTIRIYPGLVANQDLQLECSYVPTNEPDEAPLPELAVGAVEAKATELAMLLPGPDRDPKLAMLHADRYKRNLGNLKAIGDFGEVGEVMAYIPPIPGVT